MTGSLSGGPRPDLNAMNSLRDSQHPLANALRWTAGAWVALLLLVAVSGAQESATPKPKEGKTYTVRVEGQPLFNKPTASLGVKSRLPKGTELTVVASKGSWMQVQGGGTQGGWIQGPRRRRLGGTPVDENYIKSKTTAQTGTGLVTKGFGKGYGKQHGVSDEDAARTEQQLRSQPFEYESFESFIAKGGLSFSEADETALAAAPEPEPEPAPKGRLGRRGDLASSLRQGISASRIRMEMTRDPHYFAKNFTYEEEEEMGYAVAQRLAAGRIHDNAELHEYVNLIGSTLVEHSDRRDIPYLFVVLDSPDINAFAAPGGYIFITTGCMAACKNEAELAAVLGHEVAHVARRHAARQLDDHRLKIAKSMLGVQMDKSLEELYGPMDPNKAALIKELQSMADVHYKACTASWGQKFELEADEFGARYAKAAGWDYSGMEEFLKVLRSGEKVQLGKGWDSHPPAGERISTLQRIARNEGWKHSGIFLAERFGRFSALIE